MNDKEYNKLMRRQSIIIEVVSDVLGLIVIAGALYGLASLFNWMLT